MVFRPVAPSRSAVDIEVNGPIYKLRPSVHRSIVCIHHNSLQKKGEGTYVSLSQAMDRSRLVLVTAIQKAMTMTTLLLRVRSKKMRVGLETKGAVGAEGEKVLTMCCHV